MTREPFSARGDGVTDNTEAFIEALTFAKSEKLTLYVPDGTYLVRDELVYRNPTSYGRTTAEMNADVRVHGQSRTGTVIRLADNSPGYGAGSRKAVLTTIHSDRWSNVGFNNEIANLTVDTGRGNPGAVGIRFNGANVGAMRNVTIKAEGMSGLVGLELPPHGPAYVAHVDVHGFETGIVAYCANSTWVLEHITLRNQRSVGLVNDQSPMSIRGLLSDNTVPAVRNQREGQLILLDAQLRGGSAQTAAVANSEVENSTAFLLARHVTVTGYGYALDDRGRHVSGPFITEYSSHGVQRLSQDSPKAGLGLPAEETPPVPWDPPAQWVCVEAFGAVGDGEHDDTSAFQRAMLSGATTLYAVSGRTYRISDTIDVGGNVRRLHLGWARFRLRGNLNNPRQPVFRVVDGTSPTVWIEKAVIWPVREDEYLINVPFVGHASTRTVVLRDLFMSGGRGYFNEVSGGRVYIENMMGKARNALDDPTTFEFNGQKVWARQLNPDGGRHVVNDGGLLWVLGFKTENSPTRFTTLNGGLTEILGGCAWISGIRENRYRVEPALVNEDSHVSASFMETYHDLVVEPAAIAVAVRETRVDEKRTMNADALPQKVFTHNNGMVLPLYTGYARDAVDARLGELGLNRQE
ncbi:MAG: hypothetical protein JXB13_15555 [Phycisphaerae bacterium]|nr:hypothetical protein [Phycisphaerae bacterium]